MKKVLSILAFCLLFVFCTINFAACNNGNTADKPVYTQSKLVVVFAKLDSASMSTNIIYTANFLPTIQEFMLSRKFIRRANEIYENEFGENSTIISVQSIDIKRSGDILLTISYKDYDNEIAANKLNAFIKAAQEILSEELLADEIDFIIMETY